MTVIAGSWARIAHPSRSLVGVAEQVALHMGNCPPHDRAELQ